MPRLIVLKFGGSVLTDAKRLRIAVHEIYRWRREGWQVVAVVSALHGRTDALEADLHPHADPHARASYLASGEREAASLLGVQLDRAGLPASVFGPGQIGLLATGHPLDAHPYDVDRERLRDALDRDGVVVVPGFIANDTDGRIVTLGRGGSDLTALFLAHALDADRCRLIKDVDGLYDDDPARAGARRYDAATFEDALDTDGSIVQHKAVHFAIEHERPFELGRCNGTRPTSIGPGPTTFGEPDLPRPLRVAILGHGCVGGGVLDL
ncbi:MAG: hypothetical protein KDA28_07445, partial [Phycisphaerales bacterium]|nr:hypothetical protein [Phycisphaerales bacterium]